MRQVVQNFRTGVVSVEEVPPPVVHPGCVLVSNEWSVVSAGTEKAKIDLGRKSLLGKARARPDLVRQVVEKARTHGLASTIDAVVSRLDASSPLGYSSAGTIIQVAHDVVGLEAGMRVACAGGDHAFHAGVVCVPQNLCAAIPLGLSTEHAAYGTIGAIAMQGVRQADARVGDRVLVIGLGLLGQLAVQILRAAGCRVAGADVSADRIGLAEASGCELAVEASRASQLLTWTSEVGFDAVIITAASKDNSPLLLAAETARDRARIVLLGDVRIDMPRTLLYEKELSVVMSRSYGPGRYDPAYEEHGHDYPIGYVRWTEQRNMEALLELAAQGSMHLESLTTHRFDIEDSAEAYKLLASGSEPFVGILLRYPEQRMRPANTQIAPSAGSGRTGVALVGAGSFASRVLIPALKACGDLRLDSVVSARGLSAVDAARRTGFQSAESDPEVAFRRSGVGAAVVATRHDSHARLTESALYAGLDVLVEKPLCISPGELAAVVRAQRESGRLCIVGFNRRFAPATAVLLGVRRAASGPVQCLIRVNAGRIPASSWIQDPDVGGGRIVGEVCHFIDLASAVTESPVVLVCATCLGAAASAVTTESLSIDLKHADGSVSTVVYTAEGDPALPKEVIEVYADGVAACVRDFRTVELFERGRRRVVRSRGQDKGHRAEVAAFARAVIQRDQVPQLTFEACVDSTVATFAVIESLRTGLPVGVAAFRASIPGLG